MVQSETSDSVENTGSVSSLDQPEKWLHMYEQMLKIRVFEEHVNTLYLSAKMLGLLTCILARKQSPLEYVKLYIAMITLQALIEVMVIAWQREPQ